MPEATDAPRERRLIKVRTCQLCPFCHREAADLFTRYCCIAPERPEVTDYYERGKMPNHCPLLAADYRVTADVHFSRPGAAPEF